MPTKSFSDDEYKKAFCENPDINAKALDRALDIRKFEIDLYWKRAAYFWTFIAATLAGFVAVQVSSTQNKTDMSVLLANLGIVFSFGWHCVNRGSKHWQENWEYHVDMLEDKIIGPLYKVVMSRARSANMKERLLDILTGPSPISVSKINQLISLFVTLMWFGLLIYALPAFKLASPINSYYLLLCLLSSLICGAFVLLGRTYSGGYWHQSTKRTASINNAAYDLGNESESTRKR